jgi:hypothetical protein
MDYAQVELTRNLVLSALGLAPNGGFNVVAVADSPRTDTAPDLGTFNYQPVAGAIAAT